MNFGPLIFLGIFFTMSLSWLGLVLGPQLQLGNQNPEPNEKTGQLYPQHRAGLASQGAQIYRANGCFYCHSQQVAPKNSGPDFARGWGERRTLTADYLFDSPVMAGSQRIGPDLTNIGLRRPDASWHLLHLYNPKITMGSGEKSNMPSYPFLFEKRKKSAKIYSVGLKLPPTFAPEGDYEIVPRNEAIALVAYLQSLRSDTPLYELPSLTPSTNIVAASTNLPAATNTSASTNTSAETPSTNSPAK